MFRTTFNKIGDFFKRDDVLVVLAITVCSAAGYYVGRCNGEAKGYRLGKEEGMERR